MIVWLFVLMILAHGDIKKSSQMLNETIPNPYYPRTPQWFLSAHMMALEQLGDLSSVGQNVAFPNTPVFQP